MIEHRYPKGNQLTLRLVAALTTDESQSARGSARGSILVSIYEASGAADFPYIVRGHVVTHRLAESPDVEVRIANGGGGCEDLAAAWRAARAIFEQLEAIQLGGAA